jgi:hypothetical protein
LESFSVAAENPTYDSRNDCNALIKTETNTLIQGFKNTVIPDGVTTIGSQAFYCCTSLTSIEIPASVTYIGSEAFQGCTSLTSVTIYAPSQASWNSVFEDNASDLKIYVFSDCVDTYKLRASIMGVDVDDILPIAGISLKDAADNSSLITAADGASLAVTLQGRTLYKDGKWNTLCLPFSMTAGQIAASALAGADIRTLDDASFSSDGTLTLDFTPQSGDGAVSSIEAGKPYIIKWTPSSEHIVSPVFTGVTIDATDRSLSFVLDDTEGQEKGITFSGTYDKISLDAADPSFLYLGAENKLYYPSSARDFNPSRAYFQLDGLTAGDPDPDGGGESGQVNVRAFNLNFGDDSQETGIVSQKSEVYSHPSEVWYDLSGRRLSGKPTKPGLYINNGRKFAIK